MVFWVVDKAFINFNYAVLSPKFPYLGVVLTPKVCCFVGLWNVLLLGMYIPNLADLTKEVVEVNNCSMWQQLTTLIWANWLLDLWDSQSREGCPSNCQFQHLVKCQMAVFKKCSCSDWLFRRASCPPAGVASPLNHYLLWMNYAKTRFENSTAYNIFILYIIIVD